MGERQLKQNTEDTKRYELEVSKAMKDKDQKDTEMGEMKEKNKKKLAVDMKDYFQMIVKKCGAERCEFSARQVPLNSNLHPLIFIS